MNDVETLLLEHRYNRPYDEQTPSTLIHPNGTLACSYDRPLLNAMAREVLAAYDAERETKAAA